MYVPVAAAASAIGDLPRARGFAPQPLRVISAANGAASRLYLLRIIRWSMDRAFMIDVFPSSPGFTWSAFPGRPHAPAWQLAWLPQIQPGARYRPVPRRPRRAPALLRAAGRELEDRARRRW